MTQHRLSRVQVINWGTFDGAWSFAVPWKGLLLTGPSGAGKSSLLDAMASILVRPAKVRFNAAAQGTDTGDRDRSLVTYVRGAHKRETDEVTGEVGTAFLRKGPTWSGVALTFTDEAGKAATLLRLFHISGSSAQSADLKSVYAIATQDVDLLTLQPYVANGLEHRRLKADLPGWEAYPADRYSAFGERFRKLLGMGSEQAQILLHKTQSAKNLTNLDALFRDFMLDVPETFELSDTTIAQFGDLRAAHSSVVDARRQVETLTPLREIDGRLVGLEAERAQLEGQERHLDTWLTGRRLEDAERRLDSAGPVLVRLEAEVSSAVVAADAAESERVRCQRAVDASGGAQISTLEALRDSLLSNRGRVEGTRGRFRAAAAVLDLQLPSSAVEVEQFEQAREAATVRVESERATHADRQRELLERKAHASSRARRLAEELEALRRHRSNLDGKLLALRERLAELLQVDERSLPFVGELIQVRSEDAAWTGAIERVLGSFARTLVVPERHYLAAAEFIDGTFLGARLVYEKVAPQGGDVPDLASRAGMLPSKLELADGPFAAWVSERVLRRFAYACVDSPSQFAGHDRAVTRNGQVKHSASLHEKDDRRAVGDRSRWVLGFSTEAKEAELTRLLDEARTQVDGVEEKLLELDRLARDLERGRGALGVLQEFAWELVDLTGLDADLAGVDRDLAELRSTNRDLAQLEAALERARVARSGATDALRALERGRDQQADRVRTLRADIEAFAVALGRAEAVPEPVARALAARAGESGLPLPELERSLLGQIHARTAEIASAVNRAENAAVRVMATYSRVWEAAAADWGESREYLPEYLERLDALAHDRLPEFEERFFRLLQSQAINNIGQLSMLIRTARREIRSRVDEVNDSLLLTPYGSGTFLQIKVLDRSLPDVDQFLRTLTDITEGSMLDVGASDTVEDRASAEARYTLMEELLQRLGSADPADRAWRDRCLDTRQHVQFQARVVDPDGVQLDVFTGSGGRSGGERQKLVTFCLAAALRFQLAPEGHTQPTYALVVIDEAFDKADHEFTRAGLEVFRTFGFQLLLATPMKMLQTIEEYVGGLVAVTNVPGRGSILQELHYDLDRPQPAGAEAARAEQETLV